MSDLDITADGPGRYLLALDGSDHTVTVSAALLADLGLTAAQEPVLIRRVVELLAARGVRPPPVLDLAQLDSLVAGWREPVLASL